MIDLAQANNVDVREEIKKYGKEGTGKKYNEV
jgi:hypothetical protein